MQWPRNFTFGYPKCVGEPTVYFHSTTVSHTLSGYSLMIIPRNADNGRTLEEPGPKILKLWYNIESFGVSWINYFKLNLRKYLHGPKTIWTQTIYGHCIGDATTCKFNIILFDCTFRD